MDTMEEKIGILLWDIETTGLTKTATITEWTLLNLKEQLSSTEENTYLFSRKISLSSKEEWNLFKTWVQQWSYSRIIFISHNEKFDRGKLQQMACKIKEEIPENWSFEDSIPIFRKMEKMKENYTSSEISPSSSI